MYDTNIIILNYVFMGVGGGLFIAAEGLLISNGDTFCGARPCSRKRTYSAPDSCMVHSRSMLSAIQDPRNCWGNPKLYGMDDEPVAFR